MKLKYCSIIYLALFAFCAGTASAQNVSDYLRAAERFFKAGDYFSASQYYEKYLAGKSDSLKPHFNPYVVTAVKKGGDIFQPVKRKDIVYRLAESYRMINYFAKAEPYYLEASKLDGGNPQALYWHAKCERALGQFDHAEAGFRDFQLVYTAQDEYTKDAQKELDNIAFIKSQLIRTDLDRYTVTKTDNQINFGGATYAPFFLNNGAITFTSTRPDNVLVKAGTKTRYINKLFRINTNSTVGTDLQKIIIPFDNEMEQGVASFTPDGKKLFLTRWVKQGRKKTAAIYTSVWKNDGWSAPVKLPTAVNAEGAGTQQPFVTADGKYLLFSSDRPGGFGNYDIWYVALSPDFEPSGKVLNMGGVINTTNDDEAPFYHLPSKTLVIASNGRLGMGGYDLFYSTGDFGAWGTPVNMGYPVNSFKDDIYYASNDKRTIWNNAFFSSDRLSPCCLELFSFDRKKKPQLITGRVVDCTSGQAIKNASVDFLNGSGQIIGAGKTDENGSYSLEIPEFQASKISASATGYSSNAISIAAPAESIEYTVNPAICLTAIPSAAIHEEPVVILDNISFGFNESQLNTASARALDTIVNLMIQFPAMEIELSSHTDNVGDESYNQQLSERRAKACAEYILSKGIAAMRIQIKAYGESKPVAENTLNGADNPEGRAKNRRTELKILHY